MGNIQWEIVEKQKCCDNEVLQRIKNFQSTNVIFNYDPEEGDLLSDMIKDDITSYTSLDMRFAKLGLPFLFLCTKNIFQNSNACVMSKVPISSIGWQKQLLRLIEKDETLNNPDIVVTILSGTDGNEEGISAFTNEELWDPNFVLQDEIAMDELQRIQGHAK